MISINELTHIGVLLKPHGIKGEIVAELDYDISLSSLRCIVLDMDGIFVPFFLEGERPRSSHSSLILIDGITDENAAKEMCGKDIYALTDELSPEFADEDGEGFFVADLIGYKLYDANEGLIGEVVDYDDSTENCLLIVKPESEHGSNVFVPLVPELINSIDDDKKSMEMDLPQGLVTLN